MSRDPDKHAGPGFGAEFPDLRGGKIVGSGWYFHLADRDYYVAAGG